MVEGRIWVETLVRGAVLGGEGGAGVGPPRATAVEPSVRGRLGMYAFGAWRELSFAGERPDDPVASLDVSLLQDRVLGPVLGVGDPREDRRVSFVGRTAGTAELERRAGEGGVAFTLFPTSVAELMDVADADLLMPPKSTWFEPKLMSGLFIRRVSHRESVLDAAKRRLEQQE